MIFCKTIATSSFIKPIENDIQNMKFVMSSSSLVPCWGALDPFWGVLATSSYRGSLFPAPMPLCVSFCAWTIHGLPAQSKDLYFVQDNPWIVQIHTLSLNIYSGPCNVRPPAFKDHLLYKTIRPPVILN